MKNLVKLKPFCKKIGSGITPRGGDSVYIDSGVALIRSQNVYNGTFTKDGLAFVDNEIAQKMKGVKVEADDILLNITGDSVARCCKVPESILPARVNQHVSIIRADKSKINPNFLMYFLVSPLMQSKMLSMAGSGGTRKALTKEMIESFDIPSIDVERQDRISNILLSYDNLIDNNRKRIQLLEESARLLFREWVVYFRFPGHEKVKIIDGVPERWKKARVKNLGEIITGKTPSKKNSRNFDGTIPFIKTPDMHKSSIVINTEESLSETGANYQNNKYLPPWSVQVSCIGTVGVVTMNLLKAQTNQQINSVIPKNDNHRYYSYFCLSRLKPLLEAIGGGSTMANVNKSKFEGFNPSRKNVKRISSENRPNI